MAKFVLTTELRLQSPKNIGQVVSEIQKQLGTTSLKIQVQNAAQAAKEVRQVTAATNELTSSVERAGNAFGVSLKRFASFSIASRAIGLFTSKISAAVDDAISFQNEIVRLSQVTGESVSSFGKLSKQISDLSTNLGVSSKELLGVATILAQAGLSAKDTEVAVKALAKTALAPTFGDIKDTAEGAVAVIAQFGEGVGALERQLGAINEVAARFAVESEDLISVIRRAGGVFKASGGSLEELLALFTSVRATTRESAESIATGLRTIFTRIQRPATIAYLKDLGIELTDLDGKFVGPYEAIKRLSSALSGLQEGDIRFIQISEELGGFRQIGKVIPLLRQFEIAEKARQAAIEGGTSLDEDAATAQQSLAVQITKVREEFLALIRGISNTESFQILVKTTLSMASALLKVADALKPLIPLITTFAAIKFSQNIGGFFGALGAGFAGAKKNAGGRIYGFATGGVVPGTGNRDTVPAMLTPGEFVIRKSSVNKIGAETLAAMNENKFVKGGPVVVQPKEPREYGAFILKGEETPIVKQGRKLSKPAADSIREPVKKLLAKTTEKDIQGKEVPNNSYSQKTLEKYFNIGSLNAGKSSVTPKKGDFQKFLKTQANSANPPDYLDLSDRRKPKVMRDKLQYATDAYAKNTSASSIENVQNRVREAKDLAKNDNFPISMKGPFKVARIGGPNSDVKRKFSGLFRRSAIKALNFGVKSIAESDAVKQLNIPPITIDEQQLYNRTEFFQGARESLEGYLLEGVVGTLTNAKVGGGGTNFDFPSPFTKASKERLKRLFANDDDFIDKLKAADAKRKAETAIKGDGALYNKVAKDIGERAAKGESPLKLAFAKGGAAPSDTVPALLTPGEFVVNRKAAQNIGYGNLNRMNKHGVTGFAKGGPVGGATGGGDNLGGFSKIALVLPLIQSAISQLGDKSKTASDTMAATTITLERFAGAITQIGIIFYGWKQADTYFKNFGRSIKDSTEEIQNKTKIESESVKATTSTSPKAKKDNVEALTKKRNDLARKELENGRITSLAFKEMAKRQGVSEDSLKKPKIATNYEDFAKAQINRKNVFAASKKVIEVASKNKDISADRRDAIIQNAKKQYTKAILEEQAAKEKLYTSTSKLTKITQQLNSAVEKRAMAIQPKDGGIRGAVGRGLGAAGRGLARGAAGGFTILAISKAIADAVSGVISDMADRRKELARDKGDVRGAAAAARTGALASGMAEAFSIGGIAQQISDRFTGKDTFVKGIANRAKVASAQEAVSVAGTNVETALKESEKKSGKFSKNGVVDTARLTNELAGSISGAQQEVGKLAEGSKERAKLEGEVNNLARQSVQTIANQNISMSEATEAARKLAGGDQNLENELVKLAETTVNLREAQKQLAEANFDSLKMTSAFSAANAAVDAFNQGLTTGADSLAGYITELDNARNTIGVDASGAISNIEKGLLDSVGKNSPLAKSIQNQAKIAQATSGFSRDVGTKVSNVKISRNDAAKAQEQLRSALYSAIPADAGDEVSSQLRKVIDARLSQITNENVATTDISQIIQDVAQGGQALSKGFFDSAKLQSQHNEKMSSLYREREQLEAKAAEAANKAIDTQIEASKVFQEFGGAKFTPRQEFSSRVRQFNNVGALGGLGARLSTGSAEDIMSVASQIKQVFGAQQNAALGNIAGRTTGQATGANPFGGTAGIGKDQREEAKRANEALVSLTKDRINYLREELTLAQKKNALEKSAIDKLLGGDVQGFIEEQSAAAAAAIAKTGNGQLLGMFSGQAVGTGLKSLEGQGLSDQQMETAASAAMSRFGGNQRMAQVFAGTTPEEMAIKEEGKKAAIALGNIAEQGAQFEMSEITISTATITANEVIFNKQLESTATRNAGQAVGLFRGGMIYASRGTFVPRGTDTVPAMLTPGEFVVNRKSVQTGNNLQVLKAMNNGGVVSGSSKPAMMASGGRVGYYADGGIVDALGKFGGDLAPIFNQFSESVKQLQNIQLSVKLDNTNVNVNFNGAGFLETLTEDVRKSVLQKVKEEITNKLEIGNDGKARFSEGVK